MVENLGFWFDLLLLIGSNLIRMFIKLQTHQYMFACILLFIVGESSNHSSNGETEESAGKQDIIFLEDSSKESGSTSSSGTDTANTPQTVVGANEKSLNDAILNDTSVSDTNIVHVWVVRIHVIPRGVHCILLHVCQSATAVDFEEVPSDSVAMKDV